MEMYTETKDNESSEPQTKAAAVNETITETPQEGGVEETTPDGAPIVTGSTQRGLEPSKSIMKLPEPTSKPPEPTSKPPEPTSKPPEPTSKPPEPTNKPLEPTQRAKKGTISVSFIFSLIMHPLSLLRVMRLFCLADSAVLINIYPFNI